MGFEKISTGGGCTAYRVDEPDAPGLYALVTDDVGLNAPSNPEEDTMLIGLYSVETGEQEPLPEVDHEKDGVLTVIGRDGLLAWYREHVGYSPDEDIGGTTPILKLLDDVSAHLLLRRHAEIQMAADKGVEAPVVPSEKTFTLTESELKKLLEKAYLDGFGSTCEGRNGEYCELSEEDLQGWAEECSAELIEEHFALPADMLPAEPLIAVRKLAEEILGGGRIEVTRLERNTFLEVGVERGIPRQHLFFGSNEEQARCVINFVADKYLMEVHESVIARELSKKSDANTPEAQRLQRELDRRTAEAQAQQGAPKAKIGL